MEPGLFRREELESIQTRWAGSDSSAQPANLRFLSAAAMTVWPSIAIHLAFGTYVRCARITRKLVPANEAKVLARAKGVLRRVNLKVYNHRTPTTCCCEGVQGNTCQRRHSRRHHRRPSEPTAPTRSDHAQVGRSWKKSLSIGSRWRSRAKPGPPETRPSEESQIGNEFRCGCYARAKPLERAVIQAVEFVQRATSG